MDRITFSQKVNNSLNNRMEFRTNFGEKSIGGIHAQYKRLLISLWQFETSQGLPDFKIGWILRTRQHEGVSSVVYSTLCAGKSFPLP
jgi:hypothetical protein